MPPIAPCTLRLIATCDLHAELRDFDYARRRPDPSKGLSRAAGVIARLRAEVPTNLLLDAGDFLHGRTYAALPDRGVNAVMSAMETLDFDAVTLGNHEFDGGLALLEQALASSSVPVVTGNIVRLASGAGLRDRFRLVRRRLVRDGISRELTVGITGLLPPHTLTGAEIVARARLAVYPVAEIAEGLVREIRDAGADLVVVLCHDGPDSAAILAQAGADAVVMGHQHALFPGPGWRPDAKIDPVAGTIMGVPAVMAGAWGRTVGSIDLSLIPSGAGWQVNASRVAVHKIAAERPSVSPVPGILRVSRAVHAAALLDAERTVATLSTPLHTYFARLGRCRATRLVAAAAAQALRDTVAAGPLQDIPVVGLAAPVFAGGFGGPRNYVDIPKGALTGGDLRDLVPHADPIWGVSATVADLALWLERSVSSLRTVIPGEIAPDLVDSNFPSATFDLPDCATFKVDLAVPPAFRADGSPTGHGPGRVRDLAIDGIILPTEAPILMAVTEHRIRGGGAFPMPMKASLIETRKQGDVALAAYLDAGRPVPPPLVFDFVPIPLALAMHRIGHGARGYSHEAEAMGLSRANATSGDWDSYRLSFDGRVEMPWHAG